MTVGVLAAFLLYLRRFFEPMQELSQFYNLFQSAAAALEKLSGVLEEQPAVPEPARPSPLPRAARGGVASRTCASATGETVVLPASTSTSRPARPSRWSARPAPASRRSPG